jgi:streptomycin 6-kinase
MKSIPGFELPTNLARAFEEQKTLASARHAWMTGLPAVVEDLAGRWSIDVGRPFQPGGVTSWVAPARRSTGERVVLKVGWRHEEALHEADGLRLWQGNGTVRLLDAINVDNTMALLLEPCEPGTALSGVLPPRDQDVIVAGLLRRLWIEPPAGHPFRPLQSMCDLWAAEFEAKTRAAGSQDGIDPALVRAGLKLFRSLPGTAERSVVLSTDLHAGNILAAAREPWLVIDPKPYVGDPTYDALQHMLNHPARLAAEPRRFVRRMASLLELDAGRLQLWLFARCIVESVEQPHLGRVAIELAP